MKVGVIVPQGWTGEYDGWDADGRLAADGSRRPPGRRRSASSRSGCSTTSRRSLTRPTRSRSNRSRRSPPWPPRPRASGSGIWSSAPASETRPWSRRWSRRSTSISGGRMELGIGAGWKRDECVAYGYGFPETSERLARLGDDLEVITRMLAPGRTVRASFHGTLRERRRRDQRPEAAPGAAADRRRRQRPERHLAPRGALRRRGQPRQDDCPPTWPEALPVIRSRCEEIGRDPGSLRVSVHISRHDKVSPGAGAHRPARPLPRARRRADDRIPAGLGARRRTRSRPTPTTWSRPAATEHGAVAAAPTEPGSNAATA